MKKTPANREIIVRALHTTQGENLDVYAFFIRGADIIRIADISRISLDEKGVLQGFQPRNSEPCKENSRVS